MLFNFSDTCKVLGNVTCDLTKLPKMDTYKLTITVRSRPTCERPAQIWLCTGVVYRKQT